MLDLLTDENGNPLDDSGVLSQALPLGIHKAHL
jgi:hypothetical protein